MGRNSLGYVLVGLYVLQYIFPIHSETLEQIRNLPEYKDWTGYALVLLVLCQWSVSVYRGIYNATGRSLEKAYQIHYWIGSLAPVLFFLHSPRPQYGMLLLLTILFFGNSLLGIVLQQNRLFTKGPAKQIGIGIHVLASSLILALIILHIWLVFSFN
ncbi:MAG: hypothetical protein RLZZ241_204 [Bacteroidota bacterium]|jgi:predicted ferric reductase